MTALTEIQNLPEHFQLTPVKGKIPYTKAWQTTSIARTEIENAIASGKATGYGLRLGKPSIGVMALDIDGTAPRALLVEIMGDEKLPVTVEFTSGKPDRSQMLFQVPEQYWDPLKSKKKTLRNGEQEEDLDFRWNGNQSVLPPSAHPETDCYRWIEGKSPDDVAIAELPTTLLEYWLNLITPPRREPVGKNVRTDRAKSCDSNPTTIPIERLLTKAHRDSLGGVSSGSRDNTGLELACDLIGVESLGSIECDYRHKNYTLSIEQNARELFTDYCRSCNPPLDERDEERIWSSAQQRDGVPSIRDEEILKNCARAYLKEVIGTKQSQPSSNTEEHDGGKPHFTTSWEGGLKWETVESTPEGESSRVRKSVGNHLEAISYCESPDGTGAGILIEFRTQRGKAHRVLVPRGTLTGDGSEALRFLADRGYHFHRKQKQLLLDYLFGLGCEVVRVYTISDKTGWVNGSFLTPAKTYGDPDLRFREPEPDNTFTEIKGTLEGWKSGVASKCEGNSRLIFSLGTVFAASLLEPAQIESGGFHLVGTTSIGKTTALYVAASVMGLKNVPNWRSTSNALEGKAAEFNHGLLPLDELNQADPQTVGASAYMLGNGQGKARMTKTLTNTKPKTWELLFLSTGEFSMTDYLKQSKITVKGGMEARMPSIPADAGKGYGAFENNHGYDTPKSFVDALETSIRQQQGTALDEYLTRLVESRQVEGFDKELRERVHSIAAKLSQQFNDTAIGRVAVRFALVQVGLELAHGYNLLPFPIKQCEWSVKLMFDTWVNSRGGAGSIEIKEACNKIELLFESNQHGDRIFEVGTTNPVVRNLLAYKFYDVLTQTVEFLVPTTVFNKEMAEGVDRSQLIAKLQELGYLKLSVEDDRNTVKRTILGKRRSFFAFREFWVEQKEDALGSDEKPTGHTGHTGQQPENCPERDTEESRTPRDSENTNGTHGTATGQSIDSVSRECPVCPVEENSTGQERDTLEPSSGAGLDSTVPCVPCVPLEKHVTQNAPEEITNFKIGDRVRYVGNSRQYQGSFGKVVNFENDLYACDFMGMPAKGLTRSDLEVI